jgi:HlyD family secretion protein
VKVERGDITLSVSGNGKIQTSREGRLTFGSAGKVSNILVKEGDKVKTGDVLAKLDTTSLELALKQAQMSLTQAEGALMQAQLAERAAKNTLDNLKNSGNSLQLALLNAQIGRDTARISLNAGVAAVDFTAADAELNAAKTWYSSEDEAGELQPTDSWLFALMLPKKD